MKLKLFFFSVIILTSSIEGYSQQTQQGNSNSTQVGNTNNRISSNQDNLSKLPSVIIKSSAHDTLTLRFEYGNKGEIKKIEKKNQAGITEKVSFEYLRSKIIYTIVSADNETSVDSIYLSDGLITKDPYYNYIYENRKLVEIKSTSSFGDNYSIQYNEVGNAIEVVRVIPPLMKNDEEEIQVATYEYYETLNAKFFFSTDWYIYPIFAIVNDDYGMPASSLFGLGSKNLVKLVENNSHFITCKYEYLSFDELGYPTHYAIYELKTVINEDYEETTNINDELRNETGKRELLADYKISYIVPVNVINGKWGCVDNNMKQIIPYKFDTATYKDFSFDGKVISCTKSGFRISIDTVGNILSLKTNAGKTYISICDAITSGDVEAIKNFINSGIDLNKQYKATSNGNINDAYPIELLLNINSDNDRIRKNISELFGLFIENGFNINNNTDFYTIIAQVVRGDFAKDDKIKMLQILVDNNVNVNEIGKNGNTVLMELCVMLTVFNHKCSDVYEISKFLIEHGADPTIKTAAGNSAIKMAKKSNCIELIELLNKKKK